MDYENMNQKCSTSLVYSVMARKGMREALNEGVSEGTRKILESYLQSINKRIEYNRMMRDACMDSLCGVHRKQELEQMVLAAD